MKLNEVATPKAIKCGLIIPAGGNESLRADDWHGSTQVFTNQAAFFKAVKALYLDFVSGYDEDDDDEEEKAAGRAEVSRINAAKTLDDLADGDYWDQFLRDHWIDDRF